MGVVTAYRPRKVYITIHFTVYFQKIVLKKIGNKEDLVEVFDQYILEYKRKDENY